jgi:hypothetical protein
MSSDGRPILYGQGDAVAGKTSAESTRTNIGNAQAFVYAFPIAVALRRRHPSVAPIAAVNLLLFWAFLGWVIALAWAYSGPR